MHFDKFFDSHKFFAHPYSQDEHSQSLSSGFPTLHVLHFPTTINLIQVPRCYQASAELKEVLTG